MPVYQAVGKVIRLVDTRGSCNEVINMKVGSLSEPPNVFQYLTSYFMQKLLFTVPSTPSVKQHAQPAVADEARFYDQSVARGNQKRKSHSTVGPDSDVPRTFNFIIRTRENVTKEQKVSLPV